MYLLSTKTTFSCVLLILFGLIACSGQSKHSEIDGEKHREKHSKSSSQGEAAEQTQELSFLSRNIQDEIFYFVMPDRFHNANPNNDNGDPNVPISYGGLDTLSKWAFHGGDIAGVEAKLDYIQNLGITSIWMTPILRNRAIQADGFAHHGYWVVDFTQVDPHFGTNDELKSLISAAHQRNIKVFFDIITNHTADVIKYKECHDQFGAFLDPQARGCPFLSQQDILSGQKYTPFVLAEEAEVKVPAWLNDPVFYNNQGDSTWEGESAIKGDFVGLDDIDTSHPEVISGMTEIFKNLITEFKPDGFRIDTVRHVDLAFWQSFGPSIISHAQAIGIPEFFIFGEVYDGNPAGLSKYTNAGKLPSVLDFGFAFNVIDVVFTNKKVSQLAALFDNDDYYRDGDSSPNELLNFIGNHDMGRIGQFIDQGLPNIDDEERVKRSKLAHALMYMSRGVPVVYYGDEQGFTSDKGDVDARENMDPSEVATYNDNDLIGTDKTTADSNFDHSHPLYQAISELASLRKTHIALRRGEHINRLLDEQKRVYAFSRVMPDSLIDHLVIFNFSTQAQDITIGDNGMVYQLINESGLKLTQSGGQLKVNIAPLSFTLLRAQDEIAPSNIQSIKVLTPYQENARTFLPVALSFEDETRFNIARVEFYAVHSSTDGATQETKIAFDTTPPYRAVLMPDQLEKVTTIKVIATNGAGQALSSIYTL